MGSRAQWLIDTIINSSKIFGFCKNGNEKLLLDLREFRRYPNRVLVEKTAGEEWTKLYKDDFVRLVYGYDMIFFVGTTRSATFATVPPPD